MHIPQIAFLPEKHFLPIMHFRKIRFFRDMHIGPIHFLGLSRWETNSARERDARSGCRDPTQSGCGRASQECGRYNPRRAVGSEVGVFVRGAGMDAS